jgi:hypothetical protein
LGNATIRSRIRISGPSAVSPPQAGVSLAAARDGVMVEVWEQGLADHRIVPMSVIVGGRWHVGDWDHFGIRARGVTLIRLPQK